MAPLGDTYHLPGSVRGITRQFLVAMPEVPGRISFVAILPLQCCVCPSRFSVMRFVTTVPAERLRSVALRYCRVTECGSKVGRPLHRKWDWGPTCQSGVATESEDAVARRQRVEAILLVTREPLNSRKLAQHARLADGTEARTVVRQLNRLYDEAGRAFRIEEVAGGFRLLTRRQFAPWLRRQEHVPSEVRLSAPAMETLAVVAYRQPVLRAQIEAIRGVNCGEILRQLMERDLVRIGGRSDELGRPYLYTTTRRFLQLFGLQNLDDLPRAMALRSPDSYSDQMDGLLGAQMSPDEAQQEQEKSEVSMIKSTQLPAEKWLDEMPSMNAVMPECSFDDDELEDDELEDEEDEEEEEIDEEVDEEDEFEEFEEEEEEVEGDEEEFDDDLEEEEWEEVEDDDEDLEDDWDDDDEDWDDDDFDDDDEDEEEAEDEDEDWEE